MLVQADIASHLKVPRRRTAVTGLLALGLSLLTGLLVGLPAASFLLRSDSSGFDWWLLLAIPILVVLCVPQLLNAVIDRTLRTLKREPLEHGLSAGAVLRAVATFILVWIAFGVHTLLLARAVAGDGAPSRPHHRGHDGLCPVGLPRHADDRAAGRTRCARGAADAHPVDGDADPGGGRRRHHVALHRHDRRRRGGARRAGSTPARTTWSPSTTPSATRATSASDRVRAAVVGSGR